MIVDLVGINGSKCGRIDGLLKLSSISSRLLKNSFASGDEAGVIAVVDEDVPDEPPGGA